MRHSPSWKSNSPSWKSNSPSASQAIPSISWYPNVHYRVHNSTSLVPILSDNNAVHAHPTDLFKIHLILSSHLRLGLPSLLFPWGFPTTITHAPLLSSIRATCPDHLILIWSPGYLESRTDHKVSHCVISSSLLFLRPPLVQMSSSTTTFKESK